MSAPRSGDEPRDHRLKAGDRVSAPRSGDEPGDLVELPAVLQVRPAQRG